MFVFQKSVIYRFDSGGGPTDVENSMKSVSKKLFGIDGALFKKDDNIYFDHRKIGRVGFGSWQKFEKSPGVGKILNKLGEVSDQFKNSVIVYSEKGNTNAVKFILLSYDSGLSPSELNSINEYTNPNSKQGVSGIDEMIDEKFGKGTAKTIDETVKKMHETAQQASLKSTPIKMPGLSIDRYVAANDLLRKQEEQTTAEKKRNKKINDDKNDFA